MTFEHFADCNWRRTVCTCPLAPGLTAKQIAEWDAVLTIEREMISMTDEEVDAELRLMGVDPAQVGKRGEVFVQVVTQLHEERAARHRDQQAAAMKLAAMRLALGQALQDLGGKHSGHWDSTGGSGSGCPACLDERATKERLRPMLDDVSPAARAIADVLAAARELRTAMCAAERLDESFDVTAVLAALVAALDKLT